MRSIGSKVESDQKRAMDAKLSGEIKCGCNPPGNETVGTAGAILPNDMLERWMQEDMAWAKQFDEIKKLNEIK